MAARKKMAVPGDSPGKLKVMELLTSVPTFATRPATFGEVQTALAASGEDATVVIAQLESQGLVEIAGGGVVASRAEDGSYRWRPGAAPVPSVTQPQPPPYTPVPERVIVVSPPAPEAPAFAPAQTATAAPPVPVSALPEPTPPPPPKTATEPPRAREAAVEKLAALREQAEEYQDANEDLADPDRLVVIERLDEVIELLRRLVTLAEKGSATSIAAPAPSAVSPPATAQQRPAAPPVWPSPADVRSAPPPPPPSAPPASFAPQYPMPPQMPPQYGYAPPPPPPQYGAPPPGYAPPSQQQVLPPQYGMPQPPQHSAPQPPASPYPPGAWRP